MNAFFNLLRAFCSLEVGVIMAISIGLTVAIGAIEPAYPNGTVSTGLFLTVP